jgi:transcription elongation GreA/GreB family factor
MARIDHDTQSWMAYLGPRLPSEQQRAAMAKASVVLTPDGERQLVARATWLATKWIPRLAHSYGDSDEGRWAGGGYEQAVAELARLTSILGRATTTEELPPERPGIVEFGDEVVVEFPSGGTGRFVVVHPIEVPLDDVRISVESRLGRALVGRRVGEQVEVEAPAGRFRWRIVATGRHRPAASSATRSSGSYMT